MKKIFVKIKEKTTVIKDKIRSIPKKKLVVIISVFLLTAVLLVSGTVMLCIHFADDTPSDTTSDDVFNNMGDIVDSDFIVDSTDSYVPQSANELSFHSNGDGTCSVTGIGTYSDTEVKIPAKSPLGDEVIEISDGAFKNCSKIVTVTVPATVNSIGDSVFLGCSSLMAIYVSSSNSDYCSVGGVLFTKDKSVLVCYPQLRPGVKYLLPTSVKIIEAYAFDGVKDLTGILFEGSMEKFQKIDIKEGNSLISRISVTCNYIPSKP